MRFSRRLRAFFTALAAAVLLAVPATASPPIDLFYESGVRLDAPPAQWVGAGDGPNLGLAGVGDLNGDGLGDLAFGNPGEDATPGGAVHVVLGRGSLRDTSVYRLGEDDSFTVTGTSDPGRRIGEEVAAAGDVNGDGFDDLMISDVDQGDLSPGRATAYIIFGRAVMADVDLDSLGPQGFAIRNLGHTARPAGVGDLDKDGFDDIAVGSGIESDAAHLHVFPNMAVVYGSALPQDADATDLGDRGFLVQPGADFAIVGEIDGAGDVNGDSWLDLVVGLPNSSVTVWPNPKDIKGGAVIFGGPRRTEPVDVSALRDGGFKMELGMLTRWPGQSVAGAGDFNGDGLDDVAIASRGRSQYFTNAGSDAPPPAVYVVFGSKSSETVSLEQLGLRGTRLRTGKFEGLYGSWVKRAGDVNGDGRPDLLIGVPGRDTRHDDDTGRAYVVFGGGSTDDMRLRDLRGPYDEKRGFMLRGLPWDETGHRIATPGDMNGDGWVELAVLARGCVRHRAEVVRGWPLKESEIFLPDFRSRERRLGFATHRHETLEASAERPRIRGRGGEDRILGHRGDNCLYGSDWNDTIEGRGGLDMLFAGPGDDRVEGGPDHDSIFGGHGDDTLRGHGGYDTFQAGIHDDVVEGGDGDDWVEARPGKDRLEGGAGKDSLRAGVGPDRVFGGPGDDTLVGGGGEDFLGGGPGEDFIQGGRSDDEIDAVDGEDDTIGCGRGRDSVQADAQDTVDDDCERVTRA